MKDATIEELAYILKSAKINKQPRPIFFLGAGASVSGNIPLAKDIIKDILERYPQNPLITKLPNDEKTYSRLMECLQPYERDKLLKNYIDKAKINVSHIYLAQLLNNEYADYILTVNFDSLMLRALSLFNIFPSTYDMAILKDLTTTTLKEKSVVYLHGQYHGLWLLNTEEEMGKVKAIVPRIFDSIKNERPWIFIGYSGSDPIFNHIQNLGRFDNGLFWITHNDKDPIDKVKRFLDTPNNNTHIIKGYDSDSFMIKLNNELELDQPIIIDKPFSATKDMLNNIVDIDNEYFKGVKGRLEISKKQVDEAIRQFEEGYIDISEVEKKESEIDLLKKEIISLISNETYSKETITKYESKAKELNNEDVNGLIAVLYINLGNEDGESVLTKSGKEAEDLFNKSNLNYQKAIEIQPDNHDAYFYWGINLKNLAQTQIGNEAENLYNQANLKFQKAIEIQPDNPEAYYNLGAVMHSLANLKESRKTESLYMQRIIIVIDHNEDIRTHIRNNLEGFDILEAENGKVGMEKAFETIPDLIITEIELPELDGIELCRKLKTDERTRHIPVIFLTAITMIDSKLNALEAGADYYLTKPFNSKELRVRVTNLITQRKKLSEFYRDKFLLEPNAVSVDSADEKFLKQTRELIESRLSDTELSVKDLGIAVGMNRMQLFRKIKYLTGQSPSEYIRTIRLKRAAQLLKTSSKNLTDITHEVGFNHTSYFAKCFKELYGVTPSEYTKS